MTNHPTNILIEIPIDKKENKTQLFNETIKFKLDEVELECEFILTQQFLEIKLFNHNTKDYYQSIINNKKFEKSVLKKNMEAIKLMPAFFFEKDTNNKHFLFHFGGKTIKLEMIEMTKTDKMTIRIKQLENENQALHEQLGLLTKRVEKLERYQQQEQVKKEQIKSLNNKSIFWLTSGPNQGIKFDDQVGSVTIKSYGNYWRGLRGTTILTNGITAYRFQINQLSGKKGIDGVMIGVCEASVTGCNFKSPNGFMLYSYSGIYKNKNVSVHKYCKPFANNDFVTAIVDMDKKTLSFKINDKDLGVMAKNLPNKVRLALDLYFVGNSVSLLEMSKMI
ncbi:spry domain-containing socs box protein [Anaeramoeba flamelloides]|uniref:Spry domain-containing socs box protein n=1 Tax=Anaeramoeba flamelloides TaxID=1746091 RepID=A0AAV8A3Q6_9EUKA|nr:spry domain-containing socs box protein [Anaeramoeba flamelloides]